jgi:hypothetical protein
MIEIMGYTYLPEERDIKLTSIFKNTTFMEKHMTICRCLYGQSIYLFDDNSKYKFCDRVINDYNYLAKEYPDDLYEHEEILWI